MTDTDVIMVPSRPVDIPARFIEQAWEHIQVTNVRFVAFQFVNDTCIGVNTGIRRMLPQQKPAVEPAVGKVIDEPEPDWTIQTLTDEVILGVLGQHGSLYARQVGDILGIRGSDAPLRQRIHRILANLVGSKVVRKSGLKQRPRYTLTKAISTQPRMPKRIGRLRKLARKDITEDMIIAQMQATGEPVSSRKLGDLLGIPRPDNIVRSKITELVRIMIQTGRIQQVTAGETVRDQYGGRLYELVPIAEVATVTA